MMNFDSIKRMERAFGILIGTVHLVTMSDQSGYRLHCITMVTVVNSGESWTRGEAKKNTAKFVRWWKEMSNKSERRKDYRSVFYIRTALNSYKVRFKQKVIVLFF